MNPTNDSNSLSIGIRESLSEDLGTVKMIEIESGLSSWGEDSYASELERSDSLFYVATVSRKEVFDQSFREEVVGFVLARLISNIYFNNIQLSNSLTQSEIEIYNLAVARRFRNHKIGSGLLQKILETASEIGAVKIYLEVRRSNLAAIKLYQRHGFSQIGERRKFYTNPTEDALLMCRTKGACNLKLS
ncbi:MAG TPA: ribosomal protein S18-alanine N-acetyltransferase [Pyrinomonadaceae bacterium]